MIHPLPHQDAIGRSRFIVAHQPITRDTTHANGWDYDGSTNQVTFYGASCTAMQSGQVSALTIVYGCPITIG